MADLTPTSTVTFTVNTLPTAERARKTIQRLMRMQPEIQKGLSMLHRRRAQKDNIPTSRAGRIWVNRAKTTKLTRVAVGETFTLRLTAQMIPDIQSVERYLDIKAAG